MAKLVKDYSECAVLGSTLLSEDAFYMAITTLTEDSFSDPRNKVIFKALKDINALKKKPDLVILFDTLKKKNDLENAGGEAYVKSLVTELPPVAEFENYLNQVRDNALLKNYIAKLQQIVKDSKTKGVNIPDFIVSSQQSLENITRTSRAEGFKKTSDVLGAYIEKLETNANYRAEHGYDPVVTGIPVPGFSYYNRITGGLNKGELIILAARPSVGKTAFAINIAGNIAEKSIPVAFFTLEMSAESIIGRLVSCKSGLTQEQIRSLNLRSTVNSKGVKTFELSDADKADPAKVELISKFKAGIETVRQMPLFIDDNPAPKVISMRAEIQKLVNKVPNLGLVVIDYLGLISSAGEKVNPNDNQTNVVGQISRALKGIARDFQIPVLCLAQLSRAPDKRTGSQGHKPVMSDLRDSGNIEQDADQVHFLYRSDYYDSEGKEEQGEDKTPQTETIEQSLDDSSSLTELLVEKNRNGRRGSINFVFNKATCTFVEQAPDQNAVSNEEVDLPPIGQ